MRAPCTRHPRTGHLLMWARRLAILLLIIAGIPLLLYWWTGQQYKRIIYTVNEVPARPTAIVFGARVWPGGQLSTILADRVDTAVELYHQGKVEQLLMTGGYNTVYDNEPEPMRAYALSLGVPDEAILLDYAGYRTYDSCYRAKHVFGVTEAILVTQRYHLDRALFTANALGIDAIGVAADRRHYTHLPRYRWRELLAITLAWWEVYITRPGPTVSEKLPPILENQAHP